MIRRCLAIVLCCLPGLPAVADSATSTPKSAQESSAVTYEIPNPATATEAPAPLESITVIVDGEARSWAPIEKGTEIAWAAYQKGEYPKAVPAFKRLAELGHPVAEWLMGNIYYFGQGVPKDFNKSQVMFEKAAQQGYFAAFAPTAQMYLQGLGTPADPSKAYYWYNIAAAQLPDSAQRTEMMNRREDVAAQLTPAQIEAAQKRALSFKPKQIVPPDPEDVDWLHE